MSIQTSSYSRKVFLPGTMALRRCSKDVFFSTFFSSTFRNRPWAGGPEAISSTEYPRAAISSFLNSGKSSKSHSKLPTSQMMTLYLPKHFSFKSADTTLARTRMGMLLFARRFCLLQITFHNKSFAFSTDRVLLFVLLSRLNF